MFFPARLYSFRYRFKTQEAKAFASFLMPMLRPEPEKRAKAQEMLRHPWLAMAQGKEKMNEDEFKLYQLKKEALASNLEEKVIVWDSDVDYADNELDEEDFEKESDVEETNKFYGYNPIYDPKLVDRSFTNLGYIGFGDGIDLEALDNTGNWQFENL